MLKRLLTVGLITALGGCTVLGPDYREPDVAWLDEWETDLHGTYAGPDTTDPGLSTAALADWWLLFDDPVLTGLIKAAREANPGLRAAGLAILESRAQQGIAGSALYPQLQQLEADAAYVNRQENGGLDNDQSFVRLNTGVNVGWELDFWGAFRRGIESADAAYLASVRNQQDVQALLAAQVAGLYYTFHTTRLRIDIARHNAALQQRSFEITRIQFERGQSSELDFQQARTQYLATLASIPALEQALIQARNALGALLARAPGNLPELDDASGALPMLDPLRVDELPARLLKRRPDVRVAAWQVAAQSALIGIAESDLYPQISLVGSLGLSANSIDGSADTITLGIGPALSWNIFDYGRIRNNVRVQDARLQQAIENYQNSVLQAAREIDDAAISVAKTRERQALLDQTVEAAQRSLDLANSRYREGYSDFQRVLDAQAVLAAQMDRQLANQGNHIAALINLFTALGGGWGPMTIDQLLPPETRREMESRSDWGNLLKAPLPEEPPSAAQTSEASGHE